MADEHELYIPIAHLIQEKTRTVEESTYAACTELWVRENGLEAAYPAQNQVRPTPRLMKGHVLTIQRPLLATFHPFVV